jgi:hypothetical protein
MTKRWLSKYITQEEFERSSIAVRNGLINKMNEAQLLNAKHLCTTAIDVIRNFYKAPVFVTSGFRSDTVNRLAGGAINSQHVKGEAIDFTVKGVSVKKVFDDIRNGLIPIEFDQVIDEFGVWVHLSKKTTGNRNTALKARNEGQGTRYVKVEKG